MTNQPDELPLTPDTLRRLDTALVAWARDNTLAPCRADSIRNAALVAATPAVKSPARPSPGFEPLDKLPAMVLANFRALDQKLSSVIPGWPSGLGPRVPALP